jgi:UDP-glucose 4-epimerase
LTRVLVTGGSGFVGRPLCEALLAAGVEVIAPSRAEADLRDPAAAAALATRLAPDVLVHLAWTTDAASYRDAADNDDWARASLALLEAAARAGAGRLVVSGSCAEYDLALAAGEALREDAPTSAASAYGQAKNALRCAARAADLPLCWARLFFLYGPGEHPDRVVASVARTVLSGHDAPISPGTQRIDYIHVDDAAAALAQLALAPGAVPAVVNVGSGSAVEVAELARMVATAAGAPELLKVGALAARAGEPEQILADVTLLRASGVPRGRPLAQGVAETVSWWRAQLDR